eukprot:6183406-Pleurochrysis_carterae.AAC.1
MRVFDCASCRMLIYSDSVRGAKTDGDEAEPTPLRNPMFLLPWNSVGTSSSGLCSQCRLHQVRRSICTTHTQLTQKTGGNVEASGAHSAIWSGAAPITSRQRLKSLQRLPQAVQAPEYVCSSCKNALSSGGDDAKCSRRCKLTQLQGRAKLLRFADVVQRVTQNQSFEAASAQTKNSDSAST